MWKSKNILSTSITYFCSHNLNRKKYRKVNMLYNFFCSKNWKRWKRNAMTFCWQIWEALCHCQTQKKLIIQFVFDGDKKVRREKRDYDYLLSSDYFIRKVLTLSPTYHSNNHDISCPQTVLDKTLSALSIFVCKFSITFCPSNYFEHSHLAFVFQSFVDDKWRAHIIFNSLCKCYLINLYLSAD